MSPLAGWENFYVIVGSSGAALIGLQFVVIALVADVRRKVGAAGVGAFGTPTVVHLGSALFVSAVMSAPWPSLVGPAVALAIGGFAGIGYGLVVVGRARRQSDYRPVWEDWLWHVVLPCAAYAALAIGALLLPVAVRIPLYVIGTAAFGLLLIGIHNAWDTVTYTIVHPEGAPEEKPGKER